VIEKDHKGIIKEDFIRKLNRKNRSKAQDLEKKRQFNDIYTIYLSLHIFVEDQLAVMSGSLYPALNRD
jgi:hypothetical protein